MLDKVITYKGISLSLNIGEAQSYILAVTVVGQSLMLSNSSPIAVI